MKSKNAFTLIEILILVVIIGLLAAMVVPAYQKIRENNIINAHKRGLRLDKEQMAVAREYYKQNPNSKIKQIEFDTEHKTIVIDGRTYKLVPQ